ncbi:uncharacterized protein LOC124818771 [Hydra vulgaris]|uniref:uncharacterized protein LOC124818771 n=1 Tax=Hydra vulgaris TaxID=6087 RepID=UPI001F5E7C83|nr:uncharacterized protein LOC124818771 [Hydra vulgaris]
MLLYKIFLVYLISIHNCWSMNFLLNAVYWEKKPFIFKTSDGRIDGIIPKMFQEGENYCGNETFKLILYQKHVPSRKKFQELLQSEIQYGEYDLLEVAKEKAIWFPDDSFNTSHYQLQRRGLRSFQLMKSDSLAIIVPRYMISLPIKMLRGIYSCRQILVLTMMLALIFGMIIWFIERTYNSEFSKYFVKGSATGLWWSVVSMTTVGYGDIVPRSIFGKIIACIWLFIGVVIACLMTATVTQVINGLDGLDIVDQKVSALENSYELKAAEEMYNAHVLPAESYFEVLELVRNGTVFAAIINVDSAAWIQKEINDDNQDVPLRIINIVPAHLQINCLISTNLSKQAKDAFNCMYDQKDEVYSQSIDHFRRICHTQTLYVDSITEMFRKSALYQLLIGFLFVIVCLGLGFEFQMRRNNNKNDGKSFKQLRAESLF